MLENVSPLSTIVVILKPEVGIFSFPLVLVLTLPEFEDNGLREWRILPSNPATLSNHHSSLTTMLDVLDLCGSSKQLVTPTTDIKSS